MGYIPTNPNPNNNYTGDCVIRAICIAEDKEWDDVYVELMVKGYAMKDMIESNELWSSYLHGLGYSRYMIPVQIATRSGSLHKITQEEHISWEQEHMQ